LSSSGVEGRGGLLVFPDESCAQPRMSSPSASTLSAEICGVVQPVFSAIKA
jgi:hypothetical protein